MSTEPREQPDVSPGIHVVIVRHIGDSDYSGKEL